MTIRNIQKAKGKTIKSIEIIKAEFGRTYDNYLCIVFVDDTRIMLVSTSAGTSAYNPRPPVEEMKKAPDYFSPEEIANEVLRLERKKRDQQKIARKRKWAELKSLKEELGDD